MIASRQKLSQLMGRLATAEVEFDVQHRVRTAALQETGFRLFLLATEDLGRVVDAARDLGLNVRVVRDNRIEISDPPPPPAPPEDPAP